MTALLSCITYIVYVFIYTPLKKYTTFNTLVGSIPGALPPVGGWIAATNSLSSPAWILFGILACWQIPHFLAIAIIYADDYKKGGLMMLPSVYMNFSNIQYYNRNISQSRSTLQNSWTWTYGGYEITYSYSESNGQFTYDYTVSMNGNNWYYISGWQNTDGSAGQWEYYFDYTNIPGGASLSNWAINFEWQNNNGNYNFEMDYDFGNSNTSVTMNVNTNNGSGNYSYFTPSNNLMYDYTWSNNGNNGTFTSYVTNPPQIYTWP